MIRKTEQSYLRGTASSCAVALIVGTGSMYPVQASAHWKDHIEHRSPLKIESTFSSKSDIDVRTAKEHLENIRTILNPSIGELAPLFEVSRQAIYKWLAEVSQPETDKLARIKTLSKIADTFKDAGILRAGILTSMKNSDGKSLFDLLKTKQPYQEHINMLITEAQIMESSYQRSGLTQTNAKPTNDWMSTISIPAYPEEH